MDEIPAGTEVHDWKKAILQHVLHAHVLNRGSFIDTTSDNPETDYRFYRAK